jgi:hypothetical protein
LQGYCRSVSYRPASSNGDATPGRILPTVLGCGFFIPFVNMGYSGNARFLELFISRLLTVTKIGSPLPSKKRQETRTQTESHYTTKRIVVRMKLSHTMWDWAPPGQFIFDFDSPVTFNPLLELVVGFPRGYCSFCHAVPKKVPVQTLNGWTNGLAQRFLQQYQVQSADTNTHTLTLSPCH